MSETLKVLVYGSLRKGMQNDIKYYAENANSNTKLLGTTKIKGKMYSLGAFPYVNTKEDGVVVGEVYETTENQERLLYGLDRLEGYPAFYNREEVDTEFGKAWVYYINKPPRPDNTFVEDGDWVKYFKSTYTEDRDFDY